MYWIQSAVIFRRKDNMENYDRIDLEVYWQMQNQLYKKVQNFSEGTDLQTIKFE